MHPVWFPKATVAGPLRCDACVARAAIRRILIIAGLRIMVLCRYLICWEESILQELPRILLLERDALIASHLVIAPREGRRRRDHGRPRGAGAATARAIHVLGCGNRLLARGRRSHDGRGTPPPAGCAVRRARPCRATARVARAPRCRSRPDRCRRDAADPGTVDALTAAPLLCLPTSWRIANRSAPGGVYPLAPIPNRATQPLALRCVD